MSIGSVFNLPGNYFDFSQHIPDERDDLKALAKDMSVISEDFGQVINQVNRQISDELTSSSSKLEHTPQK